MIMRVAAIAAFFIVSTFAAFGTFVHGYDQTPTLGYWASVATVGVLTCLITLPVGILVARWRQDFDRTDCLACVVLLALPLLLVVPSLTVHPIWSEDRGWLKIMGSIHLGNRWNPLIPKSDYPSAWQIYPVALSFALGGNASIVSRLMILAYAGLAAVFLLYIIKDILRFAHGALSVTIFLSLSTFQAFVARTGWHEISHVFPLVFLQWLFFLRLMRQDQRKKSGLDEVAFGLVIALGFWTLYTPALSSAVFLGLYATHCVRRQRWSSFSATSALCAIGCLPLIAMILNRRGALLDRHVSWYLRGGDGARDFFHDALGGRLAEYWRLLVGLGEHLRPLPLDNTEIWDRTQEIHVEWCTALFASLGLLVVIIDWARRSHRFRGICLPALAIPLILQGSRPTPWRESIVLVPVVFLAVIGLSSLIEWLHAISRKSLGERWASAVPALMFLPIFLTQLFEFKAREESFRRVAESRWFDCHAAQNLQKRIWEGEAAVWIPENVYGYLMFPPVFTSPQPKWMRYQSYSQLLNPTSSMNQGQSFLVVERRLIPSLQRFDLEEVEALDPRKVFGLYVIKGIS